MSFDFNKPVCLLTGNEFLPKEGITFADQWGEEAFLTEKIPEIAASSLVRVGGAESPQSRGSVAKILMSFLKTK